MQYHAPVHVWALHGHTKHYGSSLSMVQSNTAGASVWTANCLSLSLRTDLCSQLFPHGPIISLEDGVTKHKAAFTPLGEHVKGTSVTGQGGGAQAILTGKHVAM